MLKDVSRIKDIFSSEGKAEMKAQAKGLIARMPLSCKIYNMALIASLGLFLFHSSCVREDKIFLYVVLIYSLFFMLIYNYRILFPRNSSDIRSVFYIIANPDESKVAKFAFLLPLILITPLIWYGLKLRMAPEIMEGLVGILFIIFSLGVTAAIEIWRYSNNIAYRGKCIGYFGLLNERSRYIIRNMLNPPGDFLAKSALPILYLFIAFQAKEFCWAQNSHMSPFPITLLGVISLNLIYQFQLDSFYFARNFNSKPQPKK